MIDFYFALNYIINIHFFSLLTQIALKQTSCLSTYLCLCNACYIAALMRHTPFNCTIKLLLLLLEAKLIDRPTQTVDYCSLRQLLTDSTIPQLAHALQSKMQQTNRQ